MPFWVRPWGRHPLAAHTRSSSMRRSSGTQQESRTLPSRLAVHCLAVISIPVSWLGMYTCVRSRGPSPNRGSSTQAHPPIKTQGRPGETAKTWRSLRGADRGARRVRGNPRQRRSTAGHRTAISVSSVCNLRSVGLRSHAGSCRAPAGDGLRRSTLRGGRSCRVPPSQAAPCQAERGTHEKRRSGWLPYGQASAMQVLALAKWLSCWRPCRSSTRIRSDQIRSANAIGVRPATRQDFRAAEC